MITSPHSPSRRTSPILIALLGSVLSGCQTMSSWFPSDAPPAVSTPATRPEIHSIASHEFELAPDQNMVGTLAAVDTQPNDTLSDIARHYGLGFNDIAVANSTIRPWTPTPGSRALLPLEFILPDAPHKDIVLNLANMRLFYYPKKEAAKVYTYPVGIGRQGWSSPMGVTSIVSKQVNPEWHVPPSIQREHAEKGDTLPTVVRSGPDNPLGYYAMRLGFPSYLIHGTNKPYGIGMQISHGCIQLYPEDIEKLFNKVTVGTKVRIVHQPYLVAWQQHALYIEAHEPLDKWAGSKGKLKKQFLKQLKKVAADNNAEVDWERVEQVIQRADGIPTPVLKNSPELAELSAKAVQVAHPERLYGQPEVAELKDSDWSMRVATYRTETEAEQLAAMLNHQGPPIPARKVKLNDEYHVIAGPYKNKKEVTKAAKRVLMDFELKAETIKPDQNKS
ncbi:L,D-transpeptidase family protein [Methylomicrobium sp. Wu6]|uniref:L,D-transpeptidase family protein n=1 Tax=Methylomicrobium sp. Wu6 TaxID=3107928 RepID=UPI002DD6B8F3|nr:L,D-transpeptidase family protein [Methylomicrobium sp. Wu6]MEC4748023.1 L,D-transpeptidase family protein [Methylomicrobium sp. Wu6]